MASFRMIFPSRWPITDLPATIDTGDGIAVLTSINGHVYAGIVTRDVRSVAMTFDFKVGRRYLRRQLRDGAWTVAPC